jgi:hypothetical protein
MGVNHRGGDVLVSQQLLNRANLRTGLQPVRRKAVPERMTAMLMN